jgi:CubicO group peptidase (beta-lactamase class C family)
MCTRDWSQRVRVAVLMVSGLLNATLTHSQQQSVAAFDTAAADRVVEDTRSKLGYRGIAIAVTRGGKLLYARGYGVADNGGTPVTPDTPFVLGSTSKSFAGLAVMQLVEAGKLDLDSPVTRYLPWFRTRDRRESDRITLRMLLAHTSGLPYLFRADGDIDGRESGTLIEDAVRAAVNADLVFPPGEQFLYSNIGYKTLGLIVQSVSGEPYGEYLQRHVLAPLQMNRTFTSWRKAQPQGLSTGYGYTLGVFRALDNHPSESLSPEGGVISTANDLAHYLIAQAGEGSYEGVAVISPDGNRRLHTPFAGTSEEQTKIGETPRSGYGMGWRIGHRGGMTVISHSGEFPGFSSLLAVIPESQCGVAVLNNSMRDIVPDFDPTSRIGLTLAALCAGLPLPAEGSWLPQLGLFGPIALALILQGFYFYFRRPGRRPAVWLEAITVLVSVAAVVVLVAYFLDAGVSVPFAWAFAPNVVIAMFLSLATAALTVALFAMRLPLLVRRFTERRRKVALA